MDKTKVTVYVGSCIECERDNWQDQLFSLDFKKGRIFLCPQHLLDLYKLVEADCRKILKIQRRKK